MKRTGILVIGAGAVGLSTAWQHLQSGVERVAVLERETGVARRQTVRNSGMLHFEIHCAQGSLKAETGQRGRRGMESFCESEGITFERCGKVVVATEEAELDALDEISERIPANRVAV